MSEAELTAFLETIFRHLVAHSAEGSIHYVCMDWRHLFEVITAGRAAYTELKNLCVWNKTNGGMGSLYRSKHELVYPGLVTATKRSQRHSMPQRMTNRR